LRIENKNLLATAREAFSEKVLTREMALKGNFF
jgi:hypothetical protein